MPAPLALALLVGSAAAAPLDPAFYEALRAADRRLLAIGYRLATANAPLCDRLQPATGLVIHAVAQYARRERGEARAAFGFEGPVAVEAVVQASPAERAGVRPDDQLAAIDGEVVRGDGSGTSDRDRALDSIEHGAPDRTVVLALRRDGADRSAVIQAVPACRARFEMLLGRGYYAGADGRVVHLGERYLEAFADEEIAVVVAHELAHVVLRHRERLDAAGVKRGLLKEVGRSGRLFRRTEQDADELGVHLLANAGYDPLAAARFWRTRGTALDGGVLRARTHASAKDRAATLERVGAALVGRPRPSIPAVLATRDGPLG